ncbi:MAG: methyltransferase family protein [Promethearchaeota archaeon]
MDDYSRKISNWYETLNTIIMSVAFISLIFTGFFIQKDDSNMILYYFGWVIWVLAFILAFSPNFLFKKYGEVAKGKRYVHTTKLVDTGIYSIIRHPQYGGGLYIAFSLILIQQTLVSIMLGIICMITSYLSMVFEEERVISKFGEEYKDYMKRVPRVNLLSGLIRKIKRKKLN